MHVKIQLLMYYKWGYSTTTPLAGRRTTRKPGTVVRVCKILTLSWPSLTSVVE
tara:strand:+ start:403 stop:561 length:159 start_codon:yes stop_codon:yes gene_type:complete